MENNTNNIQQNTYSQQSQPQTQPSQLQPVVDNRRHFLAVFFFSLIFGIFGVDRFYLGKTWTGLLKLLTLGGFGLWAMVDLSMVMSGAMRDAQGQEMLEFARYKKFASRTLAWLSVVILILVVLTIYLAVYQVTQFIQNGGIQGIKELINGGSTNGIDQYLY
jgi:TM2 domain-containing membrane protein YozV